MPKQSGLIDYWWEILDAIDNEMERDDRKHGFMAERPGPKDYVDMPDGTRINSSTPRRNPNL